MSEDSTVLETQTAMTASMVLATARKEMGLSQKDVADALFLSLGFIKHIDEEQIDMIPKKAFIKGYLRSYAKLVDLDPDGVVDLYCNKAQKEEPLVLMQTIKPDAISKISFTGPVLISSIIGLVCLAVIVFFVWYYASPVEEKQPPVVGVSASHDSRVSTNDSVGSIDSIDETTTPSVEHADAVSGTPISGLEESLTPESPASVATKIVDESNAVETVESQIGEKLEEIGLETADLEPITEQVQEATNNTGLEVSIERISEGLKNYITVDAGGSDELVVVFSEDCWLEVEDRDGNSVYGDLGRGGDDLTVTGVAPFKLLVGKPNVVSVSFNGDEIDLTPFITPARTAKLVLGGTMGSAISNEPSNEPSIEASIETIDEIGNSLDRSSGDEA